MSVEESTRLRPASVVARHDGGGPSPSGRPTLDDVLNNRAPSPYTLAAYTAFLSQQHCLETLEFVIESKKYSHRYDDAAAHMAGMPFTTETEEGYELSQEWSRLLDIYVKPGAPREINLPAEERDDLIDQPFELKPPRPETLNPAMQRMYDLMSDSIFIPFCNSVRDAAAATSSHEELADAPRASSQPRHPSRRHRSPPSSFSTTPRGSTSNSALQPALGRTSSARLSMHLSQSSGVSEGAGSDDSGSGISPARADHDSPMSPPNTPPQSDRSTTSAPGPPHPPPPPPPPPAHSPKPPRSESGGGWKKFGNKIFGKPRRSAHDR